MRYFFSTKQSMSLPILKKIISRDLSIFSMQAWTMGYLEIRKFFVDGYRIAGGIKRHGTFDIYRAESEHQATLNAFLEKFIHQPDEFKRIAEEALVSVRRIRELMKGEANRDQYKELMDAYVRAWPGIIATFYLPNAIQERGMVLSDAQKQDLAFSHDVRLKTEGYYDEVERYILNNLKKDHPELPEDVLRLFTLSEVLDKKVPSSDVWAVREDFVVINGEAMPPSQLVETLNHLGYEMEKITPKKDVTELKGQTAFKGQASGPARLVFNKKDIAKIMDGDVLIAPMTTPDYLPAMNLASAFVTDEGGLLCHAAIVAREMKKPCIIGTRIATEVLKDGDMVEVDAVQGIVRIITRA